MIVTQESSNNPSLWQQVEPLLHQQKLPKHNCPKVSAWRCKKAGQSPCRSKYIQTSATFFWMQRHKINFFQPSKRQSQPHPFRTPKPPHRPKKSYPRHCLAGRIINLKSRYWRVSWIGLTEKNGWCPTKNNIYQPFPGRCCGVCTGIPHFVMLALCRLCQTQLLPYLFVQKIQKWCWCWLVDSEHSHEHNILLASIP